MASARPHLASVCSAFYLWGMAPHPFELRMLVAQQGCEDDPKGISKVNELIDMVPGDDSWIFTPADDTLQDERLFNQFGKVIWENPNAAAVLFDQMRSPGFILECGPQNVGIGRVCGGQIFWKKSTLGTSRFDFATYAHECDGQLIVSKFEEHKKDFVFVNQPLCKFNSLQWS